MGKWYPYIVAFFYFLNIAIIIYTITTEICKQKLMKRIKRRKHIWLKKEAYNRK